MAADADAGAKLDRVETASSKAGAVAISVVEVMIPWRRSLNDGAVDAAGHAEIVGVDDEPAHGFSVASNKTGPPQRPVVRK